jgi:hypothetical protein
VPIEGNLKVRDPVWLSPALRLEENKMVKKKVVDVIPSATADAGTADKLLR